MEWVPWGSLLFYHLPWGDPHANFTNQEERLWVADPKGVHHILQGSGDLYERPFTVKEMAMVLSGGSRGTLEGKLFLIYRAM